MRERPDFATDLTRRDLLNAAAESGLAAFTAIAVANPLRVTRAGHDCAEKDRPIDTPGSLGVAAGVGALAAGFTALCGFLGRESALVDAIDIHESEHNPDYDRRKVLSAMACLTSAAVALPFGTTMANDPQGVLAVCREPATAKPTFVQNIADADRETFLAGRE